MPYFKRPIFCFKIGGRRRLLLLVSTVVRYTSMQNLRGL